MRSFKDLLNATGFQNPLIGNSIPSYKFYNSSTVTTNYLATTAMLTNTYSSSVTDSSNYLQWYLLTTANTHSSNAIYSSNYLQEYLLTSATLLTAAMFLTTAITAAMLCTEAITFSTQNFTTV